MSVRFRIISSLLLRRINISVLHNSFFFIQPSGKTGRLYFVWKNTKSPGDLNIKNGKIVRNCEESKIWRNHAEYDRLESPINST